MPLGEWYVGTALIAAAREQKLLRFKTDMPMNADAKQLAVALLASQYFES